MDDDDVLPGLPRLNWVQTIRDPIWGDIPITEVERRIIQTTAFQRLRGIKQLGFAYLAFPGAMHTRFEHSLGVMHTTEMLLKMVRKGGKKAIQVNSMARQILRLAALLHDVGHPPFSHAMENLFTYYPGLADRLYDNLPEEFRDFIGKKGIRRNQIHKHEVFTEYIICTDPGIRQVLLEWLRKNLSATLTEAEIEPRASSMIDDVISQLAVGRDVPAAKLPGNIAPLIPLFRSIMNGDMDADKIDYLMRDNYYCGLPHSQDIDSLRDQLVLDREGLKIHRGALKFVHSLLLARYRLITEVHQDKWDIFATARVIELLQSLLMKEDKPGQRIMELFTRWNDSKLVDHLSEHGGDPILQEILTTRYPLADLARLEYLETHPSIRACIDILSDPALNHHIPQLQAELRELTGNPHLVVHIQKVKLPEFSMRLVGGGDLLRDAILRGISEESVSTLQLVIYGSGRLKIRPDRLEKARQDLLPCESCAQMAGCIGNLENPLKKILAELVVHRYRKIVEQCGTGQVTVIDFLMLVMEKVTQVCNRDNKEYPTRQKLYEIARGLYESVHGKMHILGTLDLGKKQITSSFHQQLRKYEQLGLIAYRRDIRKLASEDQPRQDVFRFHRRFSLNLFGQMWVEKIQTCFARQIEEYGAYQQPWETLRKELDRQEEFIAGLLVDVTALSP